MKYDKIDKRIKIDQKLLAWLHNSLQGCCCVCLSIITKGKIERQVFRPFEDLGWLTFKIVFGQPQRHGEGVFASMMELGVPYIESFFLMTL